MCLVNPCTGLADKRRGMLKMPPDDAGEWKVDTDSEQVRAARRLSLICETRLSIDTCKDLLNREMIFRQVRYLDQKTGEVVRAEKDVRIKRRRVKKKS